MALGILILLVGCEIEERGEPIEVYASESDNLDEVLELFLNGTKDELHCALYSFDDHFEGVLDGLKKVKASLIGSTDDDTHCSN